MDPSFKLGSFTILTPPAWSRTRKPAGRHDPRALRGEFKRHCLKKGIDDSLDDSLDDAVLNQGSGKHERHQQVAAVDDQ